MNATPVSPPPEDEFEPAFPDRRRADAGAPRRSRSALSGPGLRNWFASGLVAAVAVGACAFLAAPADGGARLGRLNEQLTRLEGARLGRADPGYPEHALCASAPDAAAAAARERLRFAAGAAGLELKVGETGTVDAGPQGMGVVTLKAQVEGRYDTVLTFLSQLTQGQPAIFVDTADLERRPAGAAVLSLRGRILCAASRR